jgi:hypothetical protein
MKSLRAAYLHGFLNSALCSGLLRKCSVEVRYLEGAVNETQIPCTYILT